MPQETVTVQCTATEIGNNPNLSGSDTVDITIDTDTVDAGLPRITSLVATPASVDPEGTSVLIVTGENYDRVVWYSPSIDLTPLEDHDEHHTTQHLIVPKNTGQGTKYRVTATLTNDHGSDSRTVTVTVNNIAPVINSVVGIPAEPGSIVVGHSVDVIVNASDENGDDLSYSWLANDFNQRASEDTPHLEYVRLVEAPSSITGRADAVKNITSVVSDGLASARKDSRVIVSPSTPGSPTITGFTAEQTRATIQWSKPIRDGGGPITSYLLSRKGETETSFTHIATVGVNINNYRFENLTANSPYTLAVQASNEFSVESPSGIVYSYGNKSSRETLDITTRPLFVRPIDPDPLINHPPDLIPVPAEATDAVINVAPGGSVSVTCKYSDVDGDPLTVGWYTQNDSIGGILSYPPIVNPYNGQTTATYILPANARRFSFVNIVCSCTDNIIPQPITVAFSVLAIT